MSWSSLPNAAMPGPPAIMTRSLASVVRVMTQPWLISPTTDSSGTKTSSRKTSLNSDCPLDCLSGRTSMPGVAMSTMKYVMPLCLGTSWSVRARQMPKWASWALEFQTFWPLSFQPPSTFSARVASDARSEPAPGSLNSWHQTMSPRSVAGT